MKKRFEVVGVGNAIVDVLSNAKDVFLTENGIEKGIMQLIDTERATELYDAMGPAKEISGGSAANTVAGLAALGASTAYVGKVKDDQLGDVFAHDLIAQGAFFAVPRAARNHSSETGRSLILVTPDGERSMNTYLGVSEFLEPDDIDPDMMAQADWLYLEGYRFDGPDSYAAFAKAIEACKGAGGKVSITLSDPFCVERHRSAFKTMVREHVDLLFCNEHELKSLYQTNDLETALDATAQDCELTACTLGAKGAVIVSGKERIDISAETTSIVDATGAGDLFASGFLFGVLRQRSLKDCGRMGCVAAAEVISHIGARPDADLNEMFSAAGL
ncbi:MAG: adenosine kinase [Pseudomonadota bacterium]